MKKNIVTLLTSQIIMGALFYLINMMTPYPGQSSGNGNPAIILMGMVLILFIYSIFLWIKLLNRCLFSIRTRMFALCFIVLHWVAGILFQTHSFQAYREMLAKVHQQKFGVNDAEYIEQITSFLSIHVNNQFFNVNTYLLGLTLSLFVAIIISLKKPTRSVTI